MATQRTLVLVKPDGVRRGLAGEVIRRLEQKGLTLVAMELRTLERATAEEPYAEHKERPFFGELVDFITGGPLVALVVEGPNAVAGTRRLMGVTNPRDAAPGTIRGDLAIEIAHAAGAIAIWAHPGQDGRRDRIEPLVAMGLDGLEVRHPSHNADDIQRLSALADFSGLLYSGGSDWHGAAEGPRPSMCRNVIRPFVRS